MNRYSHSQRGTGEVGCPVFVFGSNLAGRHGNARGADACADRWCRERGVKVFPVPAQWSKFGKRAGPRRNKAMLGNSINLVIAFPRDNGEIGPGTADMIRQAKAAGVLVTVARRNSTLRETPTPADGGEASGLASATAYGEGIGPAQRSEPLPPVERSASVEGE